MISLPETMKQSVTEMTNAVNRETCPLEELANRLQHHQSSYVRKEETEKKKAKVSQNWV